jgi:trimeric autotransporter adhesin
MKKLLTILGSLAITASGSLVVVSCGTKEDENDTTQTILKDFIDPETGELKDLDAEGLMLWYQENIGVSDNAKQLKEFLQLFAVAVMRESAKGEDSLFKDVMPTTGSQQYALENFQETIKTVWGTGDNNNTSTVQGAAKDAWEKKVEAKKQSDGKKNWEKNLVNELANTYPYVKKDFETLKKTFINDQILTNTTNGAFAKLAATLSKNYSQGPFLNSTDKKTLTGIFYNKWRGININDLKNQIYNFVQDDQNKNSPDYLNIVNLINATGGNKTLDNQWIGNPPSDHEKQWDLRQINWLKKTDVISEELVEDLLYRLDTTYESDKNDPNKSVTDSNFTGSNQVVNKWDYVNGKGNKINTFFDLISAYPNADYNNEAINGPSYYGWLTNSQRFVVDQYFKTEKPVSINEVILKPATDAKLTDEINGQSFLKPANVDTGWKQYYGFYNFMKNYVVGTGTTTKGINSPIQGTSQYNFDVIFTKNSSKDTDKDKILLNKANANNEYFGETYYTLKNPEKLLTLSNSDNSSYSDITKYSVYDFIQATAEGTDNPGHKDIVENGFTTDPTLPLPAIELDAITEDLKNNWGFDSLVASDIATSICNRAGNDQNDAFQGLYTTLYLIKKLDRKIGSDGKEYSTSDGAEQANNKVYQVLNKKQGIIAFVDTDGLHITKINGYDTLLNPTENQTTNKFKDNENSYLDELSAFRRLAEYAKETRTTGDTWGSYRYIYQDYRNNLGTTSGESDPFTDKLLWTGTGGVIDTAKKMGVKYEDLNQAITNPYEKFLVNNSILQGNSGTIQDEKPPFYKFNILKEATDAITAASPDKLATNDSWIWDYIKNLLGIESDEVLLNDFFKFRDDSDLSLDTKQWYLKKLKGNTGRTSSAPDATFRTGWTKWNNTIDDTKVKEEEINKNKPLMKLASGTLDSNGKPIERDNSHITNLQQMQAFAPYKEENKTFITFAFEINLNNYLHYNNINLSKKGGRE